MVELREDGPSLVAMRICIRHLATDDIPVALELSSAAAWNQTASDWALLIRLAPESCFALTWDGKVVATTTLLCYGKRLAWLGMVLTDSAYRGRGLASRLVKHALAAADDLGVLTVKLDATEQGLQIYRKFGFRAEQHIERWSGRSFGVAGKQQIERASALTDEDICQLDRRYFGEDRSSLLRIWSESREPLTDPAAFLYCRPGLRASYIGPCVATNETSARSVLDQCLSTRCDTWFWDILASNAAAKRLAIQLGFNVSRRLVRMVRGPDLESDSKGIYATAGFELG